MRIVSDTSPLIFLAKVGKLDFLKSHKVVIPEQVYAELMYGKNKESEDFIIVDDWIKKTEVQVKKVAILPGLPSGLGEGEKAVISLAVAEKIDLVLIDERKARIVSSFYGLKARGTIAVIYDQFLAKKITSKECKNLVLELVKKGYRIKEEILVELLQSIEIFKNRYG